MRIDVTLPDLGEDTVSEVTISAWLAHEGDRLAQGDDLLELTTDKAAFTVPCPQSGRIVERCVGEGEIVTVGAVLCTLEVG